MRFKIILVITNILFALFIFNYVNRNKYDVNNDGKVNSLDYVEIKNYIMKEGE